ncbi:protein translocase subunit SecD [Halofilum ochraceum]|uniref:protein translocase subunit SecD n=1 Tax=Halofilum ochraceum TaxID=1611323 RepID=UPI00082C6708|nr:protein translocase subunit SecD [Halofilum ochraceum]
MNRYPLWKYLLVVVVLLLGAVYALPNVFGQDPAIQVSVRDGELPGDAAGRVTSILDRNGIEVTEVRQREETLLVLLAEGDAQRPARAAANEALGDRYVVALNLVSAAPAWLRALGGDPVNLGLDLRGGVHFLLEVDMKAAITGALEQNMSDLRRYMRENDIRYRGISVEEEGIRIRFPDTAERDRAADALAGEYRDLEFEEGESESGTVLLADLSEEARQTERESALEQNVTTLRSRVNELGIAEPVVTQQGDRRIVVQLPGVQDTTRAKEILGATATLEFRLVHGSPGDWQQAASGGNVPYDAKLYERRNGQPILLKRDVIVTGDQINNASSSFDNQSGSPVTVVNLNNAGANRMQEVTAEHVGDQMGVVFIENTVTTEMVDGEAVKKRKRTEEVINVATIRDVLSHRFQIEGLSSTEARDLALLLRAGALSAPIEIIEERTIGPSLGQDNINQGVTSIIVGLVLVLVFMAVYYRTFGLVADLALVTNLMLMTAALSVLPATLTLPGIAGIVLTVGMAVDANVLIFERIREELANGNSIQASIHSGYNKAFGTIADANVTTLIAAIVLFAFGTGPIKGFAVTLSIGIITSMFTAILGTRAVVNLVYGGRRLSRIAI